MKEKENSRWIPVSDRLPDSGRAVLVTVRSQFHSTISVGFGRYIASSDEWISSWDYHTVLAWMELPKPYAETE